MRCATISLETVLSIGNAHAQGAKPPLTPDQLSSYIAVNADGTVSAFYGKMDMGHGLHVAIGQIVAEELDVPFKSVKVIMADTALTVNQGGASGSTGIQEGGKQMRVAAAEARRVLVEMAGNQLSIPAEKLAVADGVVSASDDKTKRVTYAQLIGGKYFNVQLDWNKKYGNPLYAPGKAQPKKPSGAQNRRPAASNKAWRRRSACRSKTSVSSGRQGPAPTAATTPMTPPWMRR